MLGKDYVKIAGVDFEAVEKNVHNRIFGDRKSKIMNSAPTELWGIENYLEYINLVIRDDKNPDELSLYEKEREYHEKKINEILIEKENKLLVNGKKFIRMEQHIEEWADQKKRIILNSVDEVSGLKKYLEGLNFEKKMLGYEYHEHINFLLEREIKNTEIEIDIILRGSKNYEERHYKYLKMFGY